VLIVPWLVLLRSLLMEGMDPIEDLVELAPLRLCSTRPMSARLVHVFRSDGVAFVNTLLRDTLEPSPDGATAVLATDKPCALLNLSAS
jgi:hypothetical protein